MLRSLAALVMEDASISEMSRDLITFVWIPRTKATEPLNVNHIQHLCYCCQTLHPFMHNLLLLVLSCGTNVCT